MSRRSPNGPVFYLALGLVLPIVFGSRVQAADASDGKALALDRGKGNCVSCHEFKGGELPGSIGPPLNDMKARFPDRSELVGIVSDETKRNPQTVMPPFGRNRILDENEISAIVEFLYTL